MPLHDTEFARRDAGAIECRSEPMRVSWSFTNLASADAHTLDARFACSVRVADTPADRKMFVEVFLTTSDSVDTEAISRYFARTLQSTLAGAVGAYSAADLVNTDHNPELIAALTKSAQGIAFACGLELLAPFQLDIESPSLQRQRLEEIARTRAQERTAGQLQQLQYATQLLEQFQQMRQAAPDLSAGKLLEQMSTPDRGLTLQTLLLASSDRSAHKTLWAVAGQTLIKIDPRVTPPSLELIDLPTDLGPLRSVQPVAIDTTRMLLVGAQRGVILVSPGSMSERKLLVHPDLQSPLGFNRAVHAGGRIWATHGEAGVVGWSIDQPSSPTAAYIETAPQSDSNLSVTPSILPTGSSSRLNSPSTGRFAGARNLQALDETHLIYSLANELIVRAGDSRQVLPSESDAEIIAIVPTSRSMIAIHSDGTLVLVDRTTRQITQTRRRGSARLSAAGAMPWLGDVRLLLANDEGPIDCVGLEDSLVSEYLSPYRGLKILTAAADLIAAVTPDRQRVIFWHSWDGQRPIGEVHITSRVRHRIADIEWGV